MNLLWSFRKAFLFAIYLKEAFSSLLFCSSNFFNCVIRNMGIREIGLLYKIISEAISALMKPSQGLLSLKCPRKTDGSVREGWVCMWAGCFWLPGGVGSLAQVQVLICLGCCRVLTIAAHLQCGLKLEMDLKPVFCMWNLWTWETFRVTLNSCLRF